MRPQRERGRAWSGGSSPATPGAAGRGTAAPSSRPALAQRSAMAAEEMDGLAVSRPHYGCEYRGVRTLGIRTAAKQHPARRRPAWPVLPVPSRGWRWERRLERRRCGGSRWPLALVLSRRRGGFRQLSSRRPGAAPRASGRLGGGSAPVLDVPLQVLECWGKAMDG